MIHAYFRTSTTTTPSVSMSIILFLESAKLRPPAVLMEHKLQLFQRFSLKNTFCSFLLSGTFPKSCRRRRQS